jgi:hypothetical protein
MTEALLKGGQFEGRAGFEAAKDLNGYWPRRLLLPEGSDEHEYRLVGVARSARGNRPEYEFVTRNAE